MSPTRALACLWFAWPTLACADVYWPRLPSEAEIAAAADREGCDLIAMAVHGHKGLQDVLYGATANKVRHLTAVPVLMVRDPRRLERSS